MNNTDSEYFRLLNLVLEKGRVKKNRTGIDTLGVFGAQARFDLSQGFPLLTTKKVHVKAIIHELLWFIAGDTKVKTLTDNNVHIWDSWQDKYGTIGKGYGKQWRSWEKIDLIAPKTFEEHSETRGDICGVATSEGADKSDCYHDELYMIWNEMIHRCYNESRKHYKWYGGRGIHVAPEWLEFKNFQSDVKSLPNWIMRQFSPEKYSLDKDYYGSNRYSKETCLWLSDKEQNINTERARIIAVTYPCGKTENIINLKDFCYSKNLDYSSVCKAIRGIRNHVGDFKFKEIETNGLLPRLRIFDQLSLAVAKLKFNPEDRRIIVSAWNPSEVEEMQLPPCHALFQFHTEELSYDERYNLAILKGEIVERPDQTTFYTDNQLDLMGVPRRRLNCQLYQRSCDLFLGVPFNIASYALLTQMMAQVTGMVAGEFIHTYGDLHLYTNHLEQVKLQLSRAPQDLPIMKLNPEVNDLFKFKYSDFTLESYDPHPAIKADVAV